MAMSDERRGRISEWAKQYLDGIKKRQELNKELDEVQEKYKDRSDDIGKEVIVNSIEEKLSVIDILNVEILQSCGLEDFELVTRIANQAFELERKGRSFVMSSFDDNGILVNNEGKTELSENELKEINKDVQLQVEYFNGLNEAISEFNELDSETEIESEDELNLTTYFTTLTQDGFAELSGDPEKKAQIESNNETRIKIVEKYTKDYAKLYVANGFNADRTNNKRNYDKKKDPEKYNQFLNAHRKLDEFAYELSVREYLSLKTEKEVEKFIYENGVLYYPGKKGKKGAEFLNAEGIQKELGIKLQPGQELTPEQSRFLESRMRQFAQLRLAQSFDEKFQEGTIKKGKFSERESENDANVYSHKTEKLFARSELKEIDKIYRAKRAEIIKDTQERAVASVEAKLMQLKEAKTKEEAERKKNNPEISEETEIKGDSTDEDVKDDSEAANNEGESGAEGGDVKPKNPNTPPKSEPKIEPTKPTGETKTSPYPGIKNYPKEFVYHDVASEIINKYVPKKLSHDTQIMVCDKILEDLAKDRAYNQKKIDKDLKKQQKKISSANKKREKALGKETKLYKKIVKESEQKTMKQFNPDKVPKEKEDGKFVEFVKDKAKTIEKLKEKFTKKDKNKEDAKNEDDNNMDSEEEKSFGKKAKGIASKILDKFTKDKDEDEKTGSSDDKKKLGDKIKSGFEKVSRGIEQGINKVKETFKGNSESEMDEPEDGSDILIDPTPGYDADSDPGIDWRAKIDDGMGGTMEITGETARRFIEGEINAEEARKENESSLIFGFDDSDVSEYDSENPDGSSGDSTDEDVSEL